MEPLSIQANNSYIPNPTKVKVFLTRKIIRDKVERGDVLIIVGNKVYKLNKWLDYHPGGALAILHLNGKDATDAVLAFHPDWALEKLSNFYIADLHPNDIKENAISRDYQKLHSTITSMGLYKPNPWFWIREVIKFVILWVGMLYFVFTAKGNLWSIIFSGLLAAQLWHQAAFVAHDAGHSGISHSRSADTTFGIILAGFFGGLSLGWWKHSHYVHHIITNDPEHDPDIQHLPFFAVTKRFTQNLYSTFHKKVLEFDSFAAFFVKRQASLYYIVLAFGRFNLYVQSWMFVLYHEQVFHRSFEISMMLGFWVWFSFLMSTLPSWWHVLGFVLVSHLTTFFLHLQITLSHFGMSSEEPQDYEETFAEKALRTSMDIDCPRYLDWFHGGLQFQVEHHLYPRIPRHNLRKVQPLVLAFAKRHGLAFHNYTFTRANTLVLGVMSDVANQISAIVAADHKNIKVIK